MRIHPYFQSLKKNKRLQLLGIIFSLFLLNACNSTKNATPTTTKDPVVATLGENPIYLSEFEYSYKKSLQKDEKPYSIESINDYLDKYINFKLLILDAEKQGIPQSLGFKRELASYEEILAQPYLVDRETQEKLMQEAYERLKEEVNVSHIMVEIPEDAEPKDTLVAYEKILDIRRKAINGEKFSELALAYSQDPKAKENKGDLGSFTALQMTYPFEDAAYNTQKGDISDLLRTKFGYHFLKVLDRRQAKGKITTAHIMIGMTKSSSEKDSVEAERKIKEIYQKLKNGEDWDKLCSQFSEDATSKDKGGKLPPFAVGEAILEFEQNAFELERVGDYTKPFITPYGWHIVKLLDKEKLASYEDMKPYLKQKVSRNSRLEVSQNALIEKVQKENNLVENKELFKEIVSLTNSSLQKANWRYPRNHAILPKVLFSFENKEHKITKQKTVEDFFKYLEAKQVPKDEIKTNKHYIDVFYEKYKREQTLIFETELLPYKYDEYKMLKKEYKEGMMIFEMRERIYQKSFSDTSAVRKYFEANQAQYQWKERVGATIYEVLNENAMDDLKKLLAQRVFPVQEVKIGNIYFDKNKDYLAPKYFGELDKAIEYLKKDEKAGIELIGHIDIGENDTVSLARIDPIGRYIASKDIERNQFFNVADAKDQRPIDAKDRSRNRRVEVNLYSSSHKVLEDNMNKENPLNLKVTDGLFEKGQNKSLDKIKWEPGVYEVDAENGKKLYIDVKYVSEPRLKRFDEAKGEVINDFQKFLEGQQIERLKKEYPVKVNQKQVDKLIKNK